MATLSLIPSKENYCKGFIYFLYVFKGSCDSFECLMCFLYMFVWSCGSFVSSIFSVVWNKGWPTPDMHITLNAYIEYRDSLSLSCPAPFTNTWENKDTNYVWKFSQSKL